MWDPFGPSDEELRDADIAAEIAAERENCCAQCAEMGGCYEGSPYCIPVQNRWDVLLDEADSIVNAIHELAFHAGNAITDAYPAGRLPQLHQQILDLELAAKAAVNGLGSSIEDARCEAKQYRVQQEA